MLGVTQKELQQIDMNLYAALISEADGLDAMGSMHADFTEIYQRELARIALPKIFAGEIKKLNDMAWKKSESEAVKIANKIAHDEGAEGSSTLQGIMMRKNFGNVQGEILIAPIVKSHAEKIKSTGGWEGAKQFVMLATHRVRGSKIERISEDFKDDLMAEIDAGIAAKELRAKRKQRR